MKKKEFIIFHLICLDSIFSHKYASFHKEMRERKIVNMISGKSTLPGTCSVKVAFPSLTIIPFQVEAECCSWPRREKYFLNEYCRTLRVTWLICIICTGLIVSSGELPENVFCHCSLLRLF